MQGSEWRVRWGVKTNMRGGTAHPFATPQVRELYTSLPFASRCIVGALWSCCHGDVGQSADVRAQRVDLALAAEYKQPGLEPAVNCG